MTPENRRSAPRTRHDSVLELYDESGTLIKVIGRLVDFSKSGLRFSSTHSYKAGEQIHGRLRLLKEGVLLVKGRVVWVRQKTSAFQCGVVFDSVRKERRKS